jgi:RsiW-degrading membrane proteinase PrsW (M82 family)
MHFSMYVVPVVLPVLFWTGYHYYKDRHLPEPIGHLLLAFILGIAAFWLGKLMYFGLGLVNLRFDAYELAETNPVGLFFYAVLVIGVIEELAKVVFFLFIILRFKEFNEPIDGIIYASFIALGFATIENIQYLQFVSGFEAIARGFAGPLVHILFASIWGYYIGVAHLQRNGSMLSTVLAVLAVTALLHGIYDFVAIGLPVTALPASALLLLGIWMWRMYLIRELHDEARAEQSGNDS